MEKLGYGDANLMYSRYRGIPYEGSLASSRIPEDEEEELEVALALSITQRQRELDELFTQEPWVIEDYIYQNYTQRAIYLNNLRREARTSWLSSPFL